MPFLQVCSSHAVHVLVSPLNNYPTLVPVRLGGRPYISAIRATVLFGYTTLLLTLYVPRQFLGSLAIGAKGAATLGPSELAIPSQLHARLGLKHKFARCLPSTPRAPEAAFFSSEPFYLLPPPGLSPSHHDQPQWCEFQLLIPLTRHKAQHRAPLHHPRNANLQGLRRDVQ
ncbi:hypothetical protein AMTR_s00025p00075590 [Amborella trichopoda]|uniref:Uncharacterized protein n=1 Tax=Amborella trichopoda TaxID=13333 RepID=W1PW48_AMBTC|nr:hypothetical protein AMTR_s00025p00075590 [Amborella trichopoda]